MTLAMSDDVVLVGAIQEFLDQFRSVAAYPDLVGMSQAESSRSTRSEAVKTRNGERMSVPVRSEIRPGLRVRIVEKQNQRTGELTEGVVARILTSSPTHPHGIKVMLDDGKVGRVQAILDSPSAEETR